MTQIAALPNAALLNAALLNAALRIVALRIVVIQTAVIHALVLVLALNAVPIAAAIQGSNPARDARSADFRAAVPSLARVYWQERSRYSPVVALVSPSCPVANQTDHGRGLAVAEAQDV